MMSVIMLFQPLKEDLSNYLTLRIECSYQETSAWNITLNKWTFLISCSRRSDARWQKQVWSHVQAWSCPQAAEEGFDRSEWTENRGQPTSGLLNPPQRLLLYWWPQPSSHASKHHTTYGREWLSQLPASITALHPVPVYLLKLDHQVRAHQQLCKSTGACCRSHLRLK